MRKTSWCMLCSRASPCSVLRDAAPVDSTHLLPVSCVVSCLFTGSAVTRPSSFAWPLLEAEASEHIGVAAFVPRACSRRRPLAELLAGARGFWPRRAAGCCSGAPALRPPRRRRMALAWAAGGGAAARLVRGARTEPRHCQQSPRMPSERAACAACRLAPATAWKCRRAERCAAQDCACGRRRLLWSSSPEWYPPELSVKSRVARVVRRCRLRITGCQGPAWAGAPVVCVLVVHVT